MTLVIYGNITPATFSPRIFPNRTAYCPELGKIHTFKATKITITYYESSGSTMIEFWSQDLKTCLDDCEVISTLAGYLLEGSQEIIGRIPDSLWYWDLWETELDDSNVVLTGKYQFKPKPRKSPLYFANHLPLGYPKRLYSKPIVNGS